MKSSKIRVAVAISALSILGFSFKFYTQVYELTSIEDSVFTYTRLHVMEWEIMSGFIWGSHTHVKEKEET